jgi:Rps23 Pro-64 3,4-dihydroxylase Tpa1-like proline 4-hydroxylase
VQRLNARDDRAGTGGTEMAILDLHSSGGYLHFDREQCVREGKARAGQYQSAAPFPHIAMDDFLDKDVLRSLVTEFPDREGRTFFDRAQERLKFQFDPNTVESGKVRNLLAELNGEPFLAFLSEMTGISGLISDPYYSGGGLHETLTGGHLSVHADFRMHGEMKVERRLNLLIYLNDDWPEFYGGQLELWDRKVRKATESILPIMGRAVVFSTDATSFHGVPEPVSCPPDRARRSIATYYYTAAEGPKSVPARNTDFRARPATGDKRDWMVTIDHAIGDWVPLRLQKITRKTVERARRLFTRDPG